MKKRSSRTNGPHPVIGWIGLGHMGQPMAENLLKAGYELHVFDIDKEKAKGLIKQGAKFVNLSDMSQKAELVFCSVQTGSQVNDICLGKEGLFLQAKQGLLFIDCSSIDLVTTKKLHEEAAKRQISMLDAPVSGGVAGAKKATLTIMAGGGKADYEKAYPILIKLGKTIVHAGAGGCGQAAKICNNLLLGISMIGVSEAFSLAAKLGLDQKKFFDISSHASGQCWSMTSYCPVPNIMENVPANNDYEAGFTAKMMLKDLRLGQHAAESVDALIPLGSVATELYELYVNQGFGEKDFSGIINLIGSVPT